MADENDTRIEDDSSERTDDSISEVLLLTDPSARGVYKDGTLPVGNSTYSTDNGCSKAHNGNQQNQQEGTFPTKLVDGNGKHGRCDARQAQPDTEASLLKPGANPANTSTPTGSVYRNVSLPLSTSVPPSGSCIPRRILSAGSIPVIPRNASTGSLSTKGSHIPVSLKTISLSRGKSLNNTCDNSSSTDAASKKVSSTNHSSSTFINPKTTVPNNYGPAPKTPPLASSKKSTSDRITREFNTTPNRTSVLHHSKENGRTVAGHDNVINRKTPVPKKQQQFLGKRSQMSSSLVSETSKKPSKLQEKKIKSKAPSDKEDYIQTDDEDMCGDDILDLPVGTSKLKNLQKVGHDASTSRPNVDSRYKHQNKVEDVNALFGLLNAHMPSLKRLLARKHRFYRKHFIQEGIMATSSRDVASQIFRKVESSLQRDNVKLFNSMLKAMEDSGDQETRDLAKQMRASVPSNHAGSIQEESKDGVSEGRTPNFTPSTGNGYSKDTLHSGSKQKQPEDANNFKLVDDKDKHGQCDTEQDSSTPEDKCEEKNPILREVSKFYRCHFKKTMHKAKVVAALVQEEESEVFGSKFKVVIMVAGTKFRLNSCTVSKQNENYYWDVCDGHAEAVCIRLANVYLLHEICKAQNSQPTSIFDYKATDDGYMVKDNVKFHLFISHPPCGFMTTKSHSVSWKAPFCNKPHILACSSKILISSCLGIQGPLSVLILKPICLSSVLILQKEDSIVLDTDTINYYFKELEHELRHTPKGLVNNVLKPVNECKSLLEYHAQRQEYNQEEVMICQKIIEQVEIEVKRLYQHLQSIVQDDLKVEKPHIEFLARTKKKILKLFNGNDLMLDDDSDSGVPCYVVLWDSGVCVAGSDGTHDKILRDKFLVNKFEKNDSGENVLVPDYVASFSDEIKKYYKQCLQSFKLPKHSTLQLRLGSFDYAIKSLSKALQLPKIIQETGDKMMQYHLLYTTKLRRCILGFTMESIQRSISLTLPTGVCERLDINNTDEKVETVIDHKYIDGKCKSAKNANDNQNNYLAMWNSFEALSDSVTLANIDCDLTRQKEMMMSFCDNVNHG